MGKLVCFLFGTVCGATMFALATGTTISCSMNRHYGPMLSLSFFGVYGQWCWGCADVGNSATFVIAVTFLFLTRDKQQRTRNKEQGTRNKDQGTRNKEQGTT
jgi:hypothetical protein